MKRSEPVILRAEFNPKAKSYFILTSCIGLVVTVVGVVLLPIWIPIAFLVAEKWFRSLECVLTEKTLRFRKGVLVKVEKTVPLDKITDLGSTQGPIQRAFGIESMTIETAGSTSAGALLSLPGVIDPEGFRDSVLEQKEKLLGATEIGEASPAPRLPETSLDSGETVALLREIRDSLRRIEEGGRGPGDTA